MKIHPIFAAAFLGVLAPLGLAGAQTQARQSGSAASRPTSQSSAARRQTTSRSSADRNSAAVQSGTNVSAELLTSLDARHAKPGKRVVAKVTRDVKQDGHTVIHKGSKLVGQVVSAQASGKGSAGSSLQVVFDQLVQGNSTTSLNTVVTSIVSVPAMPAAESMPMRGTMPAPMSGPGSRPMPAASAGGGASGGLVGGAAGIVGSTVGAAGSAGSTVGSTVGATGQLAGRATGVAGNASGMAGETANLAPNTVRVTSITSASGNGSAGLSNRPANAGLASSAGASNQMAATSVFSQPKGNLNLQSGTQMQMQVVGSGQAHPPTRH